MRLLHEHGFRLVATEGTARFLNEHVSTASASQGEAARIIDLVKNDEIGL